MRSMLACVVVVGLCGVAGPLRAAEPTLAEIIEAVRENELLYANIDVRMHYKYEAFHEVRPAKAKATKAKALAPAAGAQAGDWLTILSEDCEYRWVRQGDFYYGDRASYQTYGESEPMHVRQAMAYDGQVTRALSTRVGNVRPGRVTYPRDPLAPHTLLFSWVDIPLSEYLAGQPLYRSDTAERQWRHLGVQTHQGLRCHLVRGISSVKGVPFIQCDIWLAEERNYIPVKQVSYRLPNSRDKPAGMAEVLEWQEVEPGIWYPKRTREEAYDIVIRSRPGTGKVIWRAEHILESISLLPAHDHSFFTLEFPEGTVVYHLDASGAEITKSYVVGAPGSEADGSAVATRLWRKWKLLAGIAAVAAVLLIFQRLKYRRKGERSTHMDGDHA